MVVFLLSACGTHKRSIEYVDIPPSILIECEKPILVPEKDLTRNEVKTLWLKDRRQLMSCKSKHDSLIKIHQQQ